MAGLRAFEAKAALKGWEPHLGLLGGGHFGLGRLRLVPVLQLGVALRKLWLRHICWCRRRTPRERLRIKRHRLGVESLVKERAAECKSRTQQVDQVCTIVAGATLHENQRRIQALPSVVSPPTGQKPQGTPTESALAVQAARCVTADNPQ